MRWLVLLPILLTGTLCPVVAPDVRRLRNTSPIATRPAGADGTWTGGRPHGAARASSRSYDSEVEPAEEGRLYAVTVLGADNRLVVSFGWSGTHHPVQPKLCHHPIALKASRRPLTSANEPPQRSPETLARRACLFSKNRAATSRSSIGTSCDS